MRLFHFSEDPGIARFEPRPPPGRPAEPPVVWAITGERAAHYRFPRDCPRVCFWALPTSDPAEVAFLLGATAAPTVIAVEGAWLDRIRACRLYAYRLPADTFVLHDAAAGYHVSREPVVPLSVEPVGDLLAALVAAGVELRLTPSLWPLHRALAASTLGFSMIRLRNAAPQ
jgi:hypothetical protein